MRLLLTFTRAYPWQSAGMLFALLLAGVVEGFSLSALLPLMSATVNLHKIDATADEEGLGAGVTEVLRAFGVTPTIGTLLGVILLGIVLKNLLLLFANKRVGYTVALVATDLRLSLLRALLATRWEYYLHQPLGALANAMATEAIRASSAYQVGAMVVALLIQAIVYICVALLVSWQATLASVGIGLFIMLILYRLVRMSRRAGLRQTQLLKSLLTRLSDTLQAIKPLKAMAREDLADGVLTAETGRLNRALEREVFSREILRAAHEPLFAAVIAIGIYLSLVHWQLPLASVLVVVVLMARVMTQLSKVQRQYQKMTTLESAYWSIQETIRAAARERETWSGTRGVSLCNSIYLDRIRFSYGNKTVLNNLSLTLPAGSLTALIGSSGSGKTTVVDLITGLLRPQAGDIQIDGLPLEQIDLKRWRRSIGYVPQENLLLHDTVLNNVTLGDPDLSEVDAETALRAAGAWEFVAALPDGLHSTVGERGTRLSGGQRQRIMIARALVHRPSLLILDEATSALDPASEALLCETLQKLHGRLTILAISHQPALIDAADQVYRLHNGKAVPVGEREQATGVG